MDSLETAVSSPEATDAPATGGTIAIVGPSAAKSRNGDRRIVEKVVDIEHVRRSFASFLDSLRAIIDVEVPRVGAFELEEVQFSAEISANGEFKLLGTGIGLDAKSGVTFTLRRAAPADPAPAAGRA